MPADCILVEESDLRTDERFYFPIPEVSDADVARTKEDMKYQQKQCSDGENHHQNPDSFVLQDTLVISGSAKAIALAVGKGTLKQKEIIGEQFINEEDETPLQNKLALFSSLLGSWSTLIAGVAFILFTIFWLFNIMVGSGELMSGPSIQSMVYNIQIAVVLLIVSIPEGMPLAISMALAFSIDRLKNDNLLIKKIASLETAGSLLDIVTGKTSTLTTGNLIVKKLHVGESFQNIDSPEINIELFNNLALLLTLNTTARMEMNDDDAKYVCSGDNVEVALLNYLILNNIAVQDFII